MNRLICKKWKSSIARPRIRLEAPQKSIVNPHKPSENVEKEDNITSEKSNSTFLIKSSSEFLGDKNSIIASLLSKIRSHYYQLLLFRLPDNVLKRMDKLTHVNLTCIMSPDVPNQTDWFDKLESLDKRLCIILKLCEKSQIPVYYVPHLEQKFYKYQKMKEEMHQGLVLEVSPLNFHDLAGLSSVSKDLAFNPPRYTFSPVGFGKYNSFKSIQCADYSPIGIAIDGGLRHPYNVGALLRTACYYHIYPFIIPLRGNSSLSSRSNPSKVSSDNDTLLWQSTNLIAKASAGALESMADKVFYARNLRKFLENCQQGHLLAKNLEGLKWMVISCVVASSQAEYPDKPFYNIENVQDLQALKKYIGDRPILLVVGNEEAGIDNNIIKQSDILVTIHPRFTSLPTNNIGLDSLNVSVAFGIIVHCLRNIHSQIPSRM